MFSNSKNNLSHITFKERNSYNASLHRNLFESIASLLLTVCPCQIWRKPTILVKTNYIQGLSSNLNLNQLSSKVGVRIRGWVFWSDPDPAFKI